MYFIFVLKRYIRIFKNIVLIPVKLSNRICDALLVINHSSLEQFHPEIGLISTKSERIVWKYEKRKETFREDDKERLWTEDEDQLLEKDFLRTQTQN